VSIQDAQFAACDRRNSYNFDNIGLMRVALLEGIGMADLYMCARCRWPFFAEDEWLIAQRDNCCADCTKARMLESFGLPADFLTRRLGPT